MAEWVAICDSCARCSLLVADGSGTAAGNADLAYPALWVRDLL